MNVTVKDVATDVLLSWIDGFIIVWFLCGVVLIVYTCRKLDPIGTDQEMQTIAPHNYAYTLMLDDEDGSINV